MRRAGGVPLAILAPEGIRLPRTARESGLADPPENRVRWRYRQPARYLASARPRPYSGVVVRLPISCQPPNTSVRCNCRAKPSL